MKKESRLFLALYGCLLASSSVLGGEYVPCPSAHIFENSDVNVVVLPYLDTLSAHRAVESPTGSKLAGLIQGDVLLSLLKYGHVAAIRLLGKPDDCKPRVVEQSILRGIRLENQRRGLILLWGRVFKEGTDIFVQSYLHFRRLDQQDPGETLRVDVGDDVFTAKLASQWFALPPQHITEKELADIPSEFASSTMVHQTPNEEAPSEPLKTDQENGAIRYWVVNSIAGWMEIRTSTGQQGWLHAGAALGTSLLATRLPELRLVEGVAGYLAYRLNLEQPAYGEAAERALAIYTEASRGQEDTAEAVASQLRGMIALLEGRQSMDAFHTAQEHFRHATEVLPYSADTKAMEAIANAYVAFHAEGRIGLQDLADQFWAAAAMEPRNAHVIANVSNLYKLALDPAVRRRLDQEGFSREALEAQADSLRAVPLDSSAILPGKPDWPRQQPLPFPR